MFLNFAYDSRSALLFQRWAFILATFFAVGFLAPTGAWALGLAIPMLCGTAAVHWFEPAVLDRWVRSGYLLVADTLLATLALLGTMRASPAVLAGLFGVVALAVLVGDRRRTLFVVGAGFGLVAALAVTDMASGFQLAAAEVMGLPLLLGAAFHFGNLAEHLSGPVRDAARARDESHELWALLDITDTITSSLDVSRVMHAIVERVGELVRTESCSILVSDTESPGCLVMASKGHPEADMLKLDLNQYPEIQQALTTRQPVLIQDVRTDPLIEPVRDLLLARGYQSMAVLPLVFGKEVLGALFIKSRAERPFSPTVTRFCKVAASVSANALQNAMLFGEVKREALRHQQTGEKLRRILDGTPDMIVATDLGGRVTQFNHGAEALTGWAAEDAMQRPLSEIVGGVDLNVEPEGPAPLEVTFSPENGRHLEVSVVSAPLSGPEGKPAGTVWIGRDVTQLRRVENSLAQAERLSSLGEVVAGVAHELNNPLSGVVGYAELLRANADDPSQIRDLQRIVEAAMRCQKIVFNLLSFARRHPPEKRYQSLNDCVRKTLELKAYHLKSSRIETVLQLDPELPLTCFDFHQMDQVILNLLNNAEQAISGMKRTGKVILRSGQEKGFVFVEVVDDGPGVPPSVAERIFDPFFTTKEIGKGTGLGLSVSFGLVQEHGGRIELCPTEDAGACFRVYLPIIEGEVQPETPETLVDTGVAVLDGREILIAEDEPMVLELFARMLAEDGARVTQARDGEEAWERLCEKEFDLVVVDLRMPNLSGQELYQRVAEERPDLLRRFVFATGDLVRQDSVSFLERLPNRILAKPLEQETVRRTLAQAIEATL